MRKRASSSKEARVRPQSPREIRRTRSHYYARYTFRSGYWSEFIKDFGIGFLVKGAAWCSLRSGLELKPSNEWASPACVHAKAFPRRGIVKSANQTGLLPNGLTSSVDGKPRVSRRCATEPCPISRRLSSVASEARSEERR